MMGSWSLRARLLLWLMAALLLVGVIGGIGLYQRALAEADRVFDEQLQETALALRDRSFLPTSPAYGEREAAADLVVQVWSLTGVRVYSSQRHATMPGLTTLGFSTVDTPDARWRVYGLQTLFNVIQVAQPMRMRESRAARLAASLLAPLALMLPVLGLIIWITVGRALRPLRSLASEVGARPAGEGAPLPARKLPAEVRPLVAALNDLLARLSALRDRERRFIADAAHELRTPLTALRLQLRGLAGATDSERHDSVIALNAGIDRAARLVEQMLALARQDAPEAQTPAMAPVVLADLAREVVTDLLPAADARGIDLGLAADETGAVRGDEEGLRALLRNLVDNALRYAPEHSRVDVIVERRAGALQLRVTDEGPGIALEERGRVFDRFYRVAGSSAGGSGLGLAIVRSIAEAHGASVSLDDGPDGHGLSVTVRFAV
ncbi:MAG: two-component sensor histidine kinase [Hydrocarboniphaga sp.]|uniref:ATP-binding protein n=1 Tax=Hydrocarboniphaga sp. TaxID=2033016 RepID=UPI00260D0B6F|nr:ATP-binding protein [Hydrocarboniphaga sp.]MDB5969823.1 two-component sensor histidine kinase [Hydrocarboniphaga sp.]